MCRAQWSLSLTCIFKVIQPWLFDKSAKIWHILPCCSTTCTALDGFLPYLAQMITNMCHAQWHLTFTNIFKVIQLWLCNETAIICHMSCLLYSTYSSGWIHICHKRLLVWEGVSYAMTFDLDFYLQGYLTGTLPISWIIFICGTNTIHKGMMCQIPFPDQ